MTECICPFSATLTKDHFACEHAKKIIRRGGEEFACQNEKMHLRCQDVYARVRPVALQALDLEDDLLTLPHSVLVKIQFGCLLGLHKNSGNSSETIENISTLIEVSSGSEDLPFYFINEAISEYKSPKRRRKK